MRSLDNKWHTLVTTSNVFIGGNDSPQHVRNTDRSLTLKVGGRGGARNLPMGG